MKKILSVVLSAMLAVVFASALSYAEEKAKEGCEPKAVTKTKMKEGCEPKAVKVKTKEGCEPEDVSKVSGTVKTIDPKAGQMVLTGDDGKETTFTIKKTQGKKVKAGDKVDVTCVKKGEQCFAKRITKAKSEKKEEKKMPAAHTGC